jgi:putative YhbY family RNA-binding protein
MPAIQLTIAQRKEKRAEAHHLHPVVHIGSEGLSPGVLNEADAALTAHGLIKVRVFSDDRDSREQMLTTLADRLGAAPVQHIGKLLILWRPIPETPRVERESRLPGPRLVKLVKFSKSGNHRPQVKTVKVLGNQRIAAGGTLKRAKRRMTSTKKAGGN